MAIDFEGLITKHAGEDGNIPAGNIAKIVASISSAVGREFVPKDRYNAKLDEITKLEEEKQAAEDNATKAGSWEKKYNTLKEQFDTFKSDTEAKAKMADLKSAYKALLKEQGIKDDYLDTLIDATKFDGIKLNDDGKLDGIDALKKTIDTKWAAFKVSTRTQGADVDNPPGNGGDSGANPRAAEIAKAFHERRYGKAPGNDGGSKTE